MRDDLISRKALIAEYDRVHVGPPGGARKLIEEAPEVKPEVTYEAVREYCRKRCLCIVDGALLKEYASTQPEIVRCENCGWWQKEWPADGMGRHYCTMVDDRTDREFYCANAERREE